MYELKIKQDGYNREVKFHILDGEDAIAVIRALRRYCDENTEFELKTKVDIPVDEEMKEGEE